MKFFCCVHSIEKTIEKILHLAFSTVKLFFLNFRCLVFSEAVGISLKRFNVCLFLLIAFLTL